MAALACVSLHISSRPLPTAMLPPSLPASPPRPATPRSIASPPPPPPRAPKSQRCRAASGSIWCCNKVPRGFVLLLMLVPWFFLLLHLCVLHVEGNEVVNYGVFGSQERVAAFQDINDEASASHKGLFFTFTEAVGVSSDQRETQSSSTDNLLEASKLALEFTTQLLSDGIELQPHEGIQGFQNYFRGQAGEGQSSDPNSADFTESKKAATTLFCFSSQKMNSTSYSSIKAVSLSSNQLEKKLPEFKGSLSPAPKVAIIPPFLEWGPQPLFLPSVLSLTILNTCNNYGLDIFQPFSTNSQFSTYGFKQTTISPGGTLSIPVIFLPTSLGVNKGAFVVQTSQGGFLIQVQGEGIDSPYQLRPLSSLNGVIGSKLLHSIIFYNPYDNPLHVEEIYAWVVDSQKKTIPSSLVDSQKGEGILCKRYSLISEDVAMGHINCMRSAGCPGGIIHLKPSGDWILEPHSSHPIAELELEINTEGPIIGALCIKVSNHQRQMFQNLVLPLHVQFLEKTVKSGNVYTIPEVLDFGVLGKNQKVKQAIILVNQLDFLHVERIYTSSEDINIIDIEYADGLIVRPGTESQIAFVTYAGIEERSCWVYNMCYARNCSQLVIQTNATVIKLPYQAVVFHGSSECSFLPSSPVLRSLRVSMQNICFKRVLNLQIQNSYPVPLIVIRELEKRALHLELEVDYPITHKHRKCDTGSSNSVLEASELLFPTVHISREEIQWVTVKNPSDQPIMIRLIVIPEAEGSQYVSKELEFNASLSSAYPVVKAGHGIGIFEDQGMAIHKEIFSVVENGLVEALVQPKSSANLGPIVFRPVECFVWTSLLMVQNNLTGVEWILVQGLGGSSDLTFLDGDDTVQLLQLDFNLTPLLPSSTGLLKQRIHELLDKATIKSSCNKRIEKKFFAKNIGNLPLHVDSVTLAGGTYDSHGFRVESCNGFHLSPGQTIQILISYQLDFTGVFNRELQFLTPSGMFTVPVRANLAPDVLSVCQKPPVFLKYQSLSLHVSVMLLFSLLIICMKMSKKGRFGASTSQHSSLSKSTNFFSSSDLRIGKKGKECGYQSPKSASLSSPTMTHAHSPFNSNRSYFFGIATSIFNILALLKSVSSLAVMASTESKVSKVEYTVRGATILNAGRTKHGNGCFSTGNFKPAERKGIGAIAQSGNKATCQSPSFTTVNQGSSKASCATVDGTTTMVESSQEQHLATMQLTSDPGILSFLPTTEPQIGQSCSSISQLTNLKSQVSSKTEHIEEKKERGKRKKKKNNVPTVKQDMENETRSGNSSPSSPATPVHASRSVSPLLPSHAVSHISKTLVATNGNSLQKRLQSHHFVEYEGSALHDVHLASDVPEKVVDASSTMLQKQLSCGSTKNKKGPAIQFSKDKGKGVVGVAGTTVTSCKSVQTHKCTNSVGTLNPERSSDCRPILTACATFPGGGRKPMWDASSVNLEKDRQPFSTSSPSHAYLPAAAPLSKAPGTKPVRDNVSHSGKDCGSLFSGQLDFNSTQQTGEKTHETNESLYDIWGDHFVEIRRGSSYSGFKRSAIVEVTHSSQIGSVEASQSLFTQSGFIGPLSKFSTPVAPCSVFPPDSSLPICSTTNSHFASHRLSPLLSDWVQDE